MVGEHDMHKLMIYSIGHDLRAISHDINPPGEYAVASKLKRGGAAGVDGRSAYGSGEGLGRGMHVDDAAHSPRSWRLFSKQCGEGLPSHRFGMLADGSATGIAGATHHDAAGVEMLCRPCRYVQHRPGEQDEQHW